MPFAAMDCHGVNQAAAIAAIRARASLGKAGGCADGRKLALVVEGGGMRGVCSGGGIIALEDLRLTNVFDHVYGTSAGVMNASYFLSGQARMGIRIYFEDMIRREVVNMLRFWRVFDVARLFDRAVLASKRLDLDAILRSPSKLFIAALEKETALPVLFDAHALGTEALLLSALRAATAIPVLDNRPVTLVGRRCMDGGIVNAFPIQDAIAAGCTDILVLLTRPCGFRRPGPSRTMRWVFNRVCAGSNAALRRAYERHHERDAELRDLAFGRVSAPPNVNIATICTDDDERVQRMTTDPAQLHASAVSFGRKTLRVFGADPSSWSIDAPQ
jgi:predicted patatin/cPLA2 family phospholipase